MAEDLNRHCSKEDIQMTDKYMKRCSAYLIIREIQIKTTMRYPSTQLKMAVIKKSINNKWQREWAEREPSHIVSGNVNWYRYYGEEYGESLKTQNRINILLRNSTPVHIPRENHNSKRYMHSNIHLQ